MEGTSFKTPVAGKPYHIISVEGGYLSGKTRFGLSAPGPIAYQSTDFSTDGVIDEFLSDGKDVRVAEYRTHIDTSADEMFREAKNEQSDSLKEKAFKLADQQAARITRETWNPFKNDFMSAVNSSEIRTIVWDTADQVNDILRMAYYGKIERNNQLGNGLLNAELKDLVRAAAAAKKNFILLHHLGDVYKDYDDGKGGSKSVKVEGQYKRRGNANIDNLVQSFVRSEYFPPAAKAAEDDQGLWRMTIKKARLNPAANNKTVDNADWAGLMSVLMPRVDPMVWLD